MTEAFDSREINIKNPEIEQSRRMNYSGELLKRPIEEGELGYDKIYIQGEIKRDGNLWIVETKSNVPTVVLNDRIKAEFGLSESPTVNELRKGNSKNSLVSGGSFIWVYQEGIPKLTLIKRDSEAPTDANCLTGPAGRCGEILSKTCLDETNQELIFIKDRKHVRDRIMLVGYYRDESTKEEVIHQKLRQIKDVYDSLAQKGRFDDLNLLKRIRGEDDVELMRLDDIKATDQGLDTVVTMVDGKEISRINNTVAFLDNTNNTLEVRQIMKVHIPDGNELVRVMDGEIFGREVKTVSNLGELYNQPIVPTLKNYCLRFSEK